MKFNNEKVQTLLIAYDPKRFWKEMKVGGSALDLILTFELWIMLLFIGFVLFPFIMLDSISLE